MTELIATSKTLREKNPENVVGRHESESLQGRKEHHIPDVDLGRRRLTAIKLRKITFKYNGLIRLSDLVIARSAATKQSRGQYSEPLDCFVPRNDAQFTIVQND